MKAINLRRLSLTIVSALCLSGAAQAQVVINDTLTGGHSLFNWQALNGACLTAGDGSNTPSDGTQYTPSTPSLTIPACSGLPYYKNLTLVGGATGLLPDASGQGALRLTNGDTTTGTNGNNQTGAVVSNFTFPTNEGLQVTWTSVTYGGNAYQNNHSSKNSDGSAYNNLSGADGISFFLSDGGTTANPVAPTVGALGGSLGYSCSNVNGTYDGVVGGYLGIGIDEFGNFSNSGDNTSSGSSSGQTPGAIAVRGAGHTAWSWLTANYPAYYTSGGDPATAVHATCKTGLLYNYTGGNINVTVPTTNYTANYSATKNSCTKNCTVTTGSITSTSPIPTSKTKCDSNGTPDSSGSHSCTYTNIASVAATTSQSVSSGSAIPSNVVGGAYQLDYNYPYLTGSTFPQGTYLFNQEAAGTSGGASVAVRGKATAVTYALTITQAGLLTLTYAIAAPGGSPGTPFTVLNNFDITKSNGPLPSSFRFGFSSGTGGGSNVHEITCFKAAPANTSGSTAGSNVLSGQVQSDSQVYLAYYHPINSWGALTAQNLVFTAGVGTAPGTLTVSSTVNWDAGCVLTGGQCLSQKNATVTAPLNNTSRTILSWNGTKGIPFEWGSVATTQQTSLTSGDSTQTSDRLDYLRGSRSKEVASSGPFRDRSSLLGDIVDSSPVWVGPPSLSYDSGFTDQLYPTTPMPEGTTYATYKSGAAATRTNVVYAGANDGMLHGFRAGYYSNGSLVQTTNDGKEVLSYVPAQVVSTIHSTTGALDFSSPSYSHNFFVDASPAQGDLYYGTPGAWHTWIVGGLGPGGQATANGPVSVTLSASGVATPDTTTAATGTVFALDVTDPTTFTETNAASLVKAEWSSATLNAGAYPCTGAGTKCGDHLGATYGTPVIRRLHDGTWGVIFGNGLNSAAGTAGIFIAHINSADGSTSSVQFLDTKRGSTSALNGIVQVTAADLDGDHVTDYVYAGDVQGNVWRFDLTSSDSTTWTASSAPLFTTQSGQPITSGIAVAAVTTAADASNITQRIMLAFGTGQKLPKTLVSDSYYPTTQQSIYGIWDANMTSWNGKAAAQYRYAALTSPPAIVPGSAGNLFQHTLTTNASTGVRSTDVTATVCWDGTSACTGTNVQMGWELDLSVQAATSTAPAVAEQVLFNPLVVGDFFNTNTDIPTVAQALTCSTSTESAYSMGLVLATGGASSGTTTSSGTIESYFTGYAVGTVGVATQATGTSSAVTASDGSQWLVFQKNDGTGGTAGIDPNKKSSTATGGERLTWTKLR